MSIWSWFKGAFGGGALTNSDGGVQVSGPLPSRTAAGIVVSDERAMQISAVFACVRLLSQTGSTLPLGFYERTPDGRNPLPEDHYLVELLKYQPNNFMSGKELRQALFTQRVLWGNAYAAIKWIGNRPVALTPLKPEYMTVERGDDGLLYQYSTQKGGRTYKQRDILHIKGFSTDGIIGISPIGYAREALGLSVSADQSASKSVNGQARAVLELDGFPTDEQKAKLRAMYGTSGSVEFDDGLAIVPGGMKYKGISIPPDDLQLLESRQFQIAEIARFFGVPAVMIDGAAGATAAWPASYEQQVLSFLTFGLKPYLEEFEDAITRSLLTRQTRNQIIIEHKVEGLLRTDSSGRANFYSQMVQNGLMSRNEVRQRENMPPVAGADDLTVQVNLTPIDQLKKVGQNNAE